MNNCFTVSRFCEVREVDSLCNHSLATSLGEESGTVATPSRWRVGSDSGLISECVLWLAVVYRLNGVCAVVWVCDLSRKLREHKPVGIILCRRRNTLLVERESIMMALTCKPKVQITSRPGTH